MSEWSELEKIEMELSRRERESKLKNFRPYPKQLEFMNDKNSLLVRYTKTNLKIDSYLHAKNQVWAEPDLSHAAHFMKKIKDNKAFRECIAKQASKDMKRFTLKNQQQAILKRLGASHA